MMIKIVRKYSFFLFCCAILTNWFSCNPIDTPGKIWKENSVIIGDLRFDGGSRSFNYTLEQDSLVRLRVWINDGPLVDTPVNGEIRKMGSRSEQWRGKDPSGRVPLIWGHKFHIDGLAVPTTEIEPNDEMALNQVRDIPIVLEFDNQKEHLSKKGKIRCKGNRPEGENVLVSIYSDMKIHTKTKTVTLPYIFELPKFNDEEIHFITANVFWPDGRMGTSSMIYLMPRI